MVQIEQCSKNKCIKNIDLALKTGVLNPRCLDALYGIEERAWWQQQSVYRKSESGREDKGRCLCWVGVGSCLTIR